MVDVLARVDLACCSRDFASRTREIFILQTPNNHNPINMNSSLAHRFSFVVAAAAVINSRIKKGMLYYRSPVPRSLGSRRLKSRTTSGTKFVRASFADLSIEEEDKKAAAAAAEERKPIHAYLFYSAMFGAEAISPEYLHQLGLSLNLY